MLLLPAAEHSALAIKHLLEHGEAVEDVLRNGSRLCRIGQQTDLKILQNGKLRENLSALRDIADPGACAHVGRGARQISALEKDLPGTRPQEAHDALEQGGLADPVSAHEADDLAALDLEVHVAQDECLTVRDLKLLDAQHGLAGPVRGKLE